MIQHSKTPVKLMIDGQEHVFMPLVPKDLLLTVQWANDRERKTAMESIPANSVEDRITIWKSTGNRFSVFNLDELLNDPTILMHTLYESYRKANPEATEAEFEDLFGMMDLPMLQSFADTLSGMDSAPEINPPTQIADSPGPQ